MMPKDDDIVAGLALGRGGGGIEISVRPGRGGGSWQFPPLFLPLSFLPLLVGVVGRQLSSPSRAGGNSAAHQRFRWRGAGRVR